MIFFDHTYTADQNFKFLKKLEKCGFKLLDQKVEHPGKAFCRFIALNGNTSRGYHYLEFVHIGVGGEKFNDIGLALGHRKGLKFFYNKIKNKFNVSFEHKNYKWKEDNDSYLPGWNYITFQKVTWRGIKTWFNEFEPNGKPRKIKKVSHPNGVQKVASLHFVLNKSGFEFFEKVLGKKIKDYVTLSCGTEFYFSKGKTNTLWIVHLHCKSLQKLKSKFFFDDELIFLDINAVIIKNPSNMWDIVISSDGM
jgi:hypothetical protein